MQGLALIIHERSAADVDMGILTVVIGPPPRSAAEHHVAVGEAEWIG